MTKSEAVNMLMNSEYYSRGYKQGVSDTLNKIRAEIEENRWTDKNIRIERNALASGLEVALKIIDKYRESEDKE